MSPQNIEKVTAAAVDVANRIVTEAGVVEAAPIVMDINTITTDLILVQIPTINAERDAEENFVIIVIVGWISRSNIYEQTAHLVCPCTL